MAPKQITRPLLTWYDRHRRSMPWRALSGEKSEPYRIWLSEIMLQQTTVATVGPYFEAFLMRWPTVQKLAAAELDDVLHAWQGLGYYARARNLHKCAQVVATDYGEVFPNTEAGLLSLPGIGPYTAAAIGAIAFDLSTVPVDGNIERVMARLHRIETPLPSAKKELSELARQYAPRSRSGDFAQALMDLGATICTPRKPACALCPLRSKCDATKSGAPETLPRRLPKAAKPTRHAVAFWLETGAGEVFLQRRPERGMLGGMMEFPSTEWREAPWSLAPAKKLAPAKTRWVALPGEVTHSFTHFDIRFTVLIGRCDRPSGEGVWRVVDDFKDLALPTVMKKIAHHALAQR
jgi:A/G-specific adenine glycosylase